MIGAVTVFCGSSDRWTPGTFEAARELARSCAAAVAARLWRRWAGPHGRTGPRAVLAAGGEVVGADSPGPARSRGGEATLTELMVTEGLRERKALMDTRGDAFAALPGGLGTLEEILEVMAPQAARLSPEAHRRPDLDGFYQPAMEPDPAGHRHGLHQIRVPRSLVSGPGRRRAAPLPRGVCSPRLCPQVALTPGSP